jgi:hypothetical protein
MSVQISPNLPANVVEIGQEISQAKIDELNAGVLATQSWTATTYAPKASPTFTGTVTIPAGASISGYLTTSVASSTYQTLSGMSSYLTTSSAATTYATKASPTFTGTVTIPAGASISGYLTTSSAASTYQTLSGMGSYATQSYVTSQGYITDAPSDSHTYGRRNGVWHQINGGGGGGGGITTSDVSFWLTQGSSYLQPTGIASGYVLSFNGTDLVWVAPSGGGGGLTISTLSNGATSTLDSTAPTAGQALTYDGMKLVWGTVGGGGGGVAWGGITGTVTDQTDLTTYITGLGYLTSIPAKTVQGVGSGYLVSAGDQNKILLFTTTMGSDTINLPADSTYAFPDGTEITICQYSGVFGNAISGQYAGQPTINGASSVTVSNTVSKLVKIATDAWLYT